MVSYNLFTSQYNHNIDPKGRVILPSKFRGYLTEGVFITVWPGPCLIGIPKINWGVWENKLQTLSSGKNKSLKFLRFFYAHLQDELPDKQGRIFLHPELRKWGGLKKEVVINGLGDKFEIWSKENWNKYKKEAALAYPVVLEELEL